MTLILPAVQDSQHTLVVDSRQEKKQQNRLLKALQNLALILYVSYASLRLPSILQRLDDALPWRITHHAVYPCLQSNNPNKVKVESCTGKNVVYVAYTVH